MQRMAGTACIAVVLLACAAVRAQNTADADLPPEKFAILPWGGTPGDPKVLAEIRKCGFNLAGFVAPEHLDAVDAAGLKAIVSSLHVDDATAGLEPDEIAKRVKAVTDRVGRHKAVFGYYLRDEPNATLFGGLQKWSAAVVEASPGARPYINLFPNYASAAQLGTPTYDEYLESFVNVVKPPFLSYDHYALMDDGSLRHGYFQNLEAVRAAALRHKLPFWNIVLSVAHFRYAEPSPAGLRLQAYTTLAYGARGISYFTYFSPRIGNYRLAPVDPFGHKTPTWAMLRDVNLQIRALAPAYLDLKSVHVFHHPDVPSGCAGLATSKHVNEIAGGSFVVGEFEAPGGEPCVIVVNKSLRESVAPSIKFKAPGRVMHVNAYTGRANPWQGEDVWLAAGQGALLRVEK